MVSCRPSPGLLGRHQAFAVGQAWLGSQVRGRLLLAPSYHLLRPEGWHHWEGGGGVIKSGEKRGGSPRGAGMGRGVVGEGGWRCRKACSCSEGWAQVTRGRSRGHLLPVPLRPRPSAAGTGRKWGSKEQKLGAERRKRFKKDTEIRAPRFWF